MKKNLQLRQLVSTTMRVTLTQIAFIVFFTNATFAIDSKAQASLSQKITVQSQDQSIKKILELIEQKAKVTFVYSSKLIQADRKISISAQNEVLSKVLDNLLKPLSLGYEASENVIILNRLSQNTTPTPNAKTENPIGGKVTSSKGESLPGVSILVKGSTRGTITGTDGSFKISAEKGNTLVFSFIGYSTKEVTVADANEINVMLDENAATLSDAVVVGSRFAKPRTDVDRPVAVDVISAKELQTSGQIDLGQAIHFIAPSFNAVKFGINETAPFVDPASLRGLGPDQVLVLVNNKRRHKVSFLSINDGVGKGQVGTDVNVVPALSLKRIEVLRDGAAAQYGSDAIAGVINMELNDASSGGAINVFTGVGSSTPNLDVTGAVAPKKVVDGLTYNMSANFGLKLAKKGFINTTIFYNHSDPYDRSGTYKAAAGFYVRDVVQDVALVAKNNINLDRAILGSARNTTYGLFINAGLPVSKNFNAYAFGGYTHKYVVTGVFTRPPSNARRSALTIFPDGYNPIAPATLQDYSITAGLKGKFGNDWNADFSLNQGSNQVDWNAKNTVNPSLGAASPTEFYIGQTKITQTMANIDIAKTFNAGSFPSYSLGFGTELRYDTFSQKAGDEAAWKAGPLFRTKDVGSSGREGFSPATAGTWGRTNVGVYVEAEAELSKAFLIGGALRGENYSDFGANYAYKLNARLKLADPFSVRASVSRGFRAPGMVQSHYSNYINISFDNAGNSIINPIIPATGELAKVLGINGLKQETSFDMSGGVTSKIGNNFTLTADVYQVDVDNRIMASGGINVSKIPQFVAAGFPQTAVVFVNAIDTRTRGFEFVANYNNRFSPKSRIDFNLAYSSMVTTLRATRKTETGIEVADAVATLYITDGQPKNKLIGSLNFDYGKFGIMLRATRFGTVADPLATLAVKPVDPTAITYQIFSAKTIADIAVTFRPIQKLSIIAGINNIADVYPDLLQVPQTTNEVVFSRRTNQFGTQGRFFNVTMNYNF